MKQYVVDAFTSAVFGGNPAAVCVPETWPSDGLMQQMAAENRLSETAFVVREGERWRLRWFTPQGEIDLCGHATVATAFVLLNFYEPDAPGVAFETMGGVLSVVRRGNRYEMDAPAYDLSPVAVTADMERAVGCRPVAGFRARDLVLVLPSEREVRALKPDADAIAALEGLMLHVTARATDGRFDCVSRSFGPKLGIPEDPVCGSGHCHIVPYWAHELGKEELTAYQASARGGTLHCRMSGARVRLAGEAVLYSVGDVYVG